MVRADLFDMLAAALERFGPQPGEPFGGVQVVLVGDLFQLPPVVETGVQEFISTRYETPYFFSADHFTKPDFPTVNLSMVFRQQGDQRLTAILNAIREGVLLDHYRDELNERTDSEFVPPDDEFWLTLAPTNSVVKARNRQHLERLSGRLHRHEASSSGDLSTFDPPAERILEFKPDAQIMMISNDPERRWVNGTLGKILDISTGRDGMQVTAEFADGSRAEFGVHTWEATRPIVDGGTLRHEVVGTYTQLPFKLAWAITIHKSQGQTLDRMVVDLSGGAFDYGQVYVALSRCTRMDGLVLKRPVLAKDLKTDRRVVRFLRESTTDQTRQRLCAIDILTVGAEDRMSRPRPVELAVAFDDGTAISTLINPQRDLGNAREAYGIRVGDVLLAPTLPEAWAALAPLLAGCTPVGVDIDDKLGLLDFELKRLGVVQPLPLGVQLAAKTLRTDEHRALTGGSALTRAQAVMRAAQRLEAADAGASEFDDAQSDADAGYLLIRDRNFEIPRPAHMPMITDLISVSHALSAVILDGTPAGEAGAGTSDAEFTDPGLRRAVARRLTAAIENSAGLPPETWNRIGEVEKLLGVAVIDRSVGAAETPTIDTVRTPDARVCFTGTVIGPSGREVSKSELEDLVVSRGLRWAANVSKTRCEVLIVAEPGTQSGKARKAKQFGKPVFSATEFFDWVNRAP